MPRTLHIPPVFELPLFALHRLPPEKLGLLVQAVEGAGVVFEPSELEPGITHVVGDEDAASNMLAMLLSLSNNILSLAMPLPQAIDEIRSALASSSIDDDEEYSFDLESWNQAAPYLQRLLSLPNLRTMAKAIDLAYDYSHVLRNSRILTDVRPVFFDDADSFESAIVSHTLRVRYNSGQSVRTITLALDDADISALRAACDRALRKAAAIKRVFGSTGVQFGAVGERTKQ